MPQKHLHNPAWMELFDKAKLLYRNGVAGDKEAVRETYRLLEQVREQAPDNNLVLAYYGCVLCLMGRDAVEPVERSAGIIRGFKYLDQAVANEPENFEIRIIRGNVGINIPEMYFHRSESAAEDFEFLIACYKRYPDNIPAEMYLEFLYNLSIAYGNLGKTEAAEAIRRKIMDESENPKFRSIFEQQKKRNVPYGEGHFITLLQPLPAILEEGEKLHQLALSGEKKDIQNALDFFAKARVLHSDNQLLQAYHADCMSLTGRDAANTGEMFANAIKAIKTLDSAVINDPDNIKIRFIRANHGMRLPELFFARTATAIIDLEYLAGRYRKEHGLFDKGRYEEVLFNIGICYFRLGLDAEAKELWRNLLPDASREIRFKIETCLQNNFPPDYQETMSSQTDREEFYAEAKRLHNLGVAGNKTAARLALDLWGKAHVSDPADSLAQGYYGSSLALAGRDATDINGMFGGAIKGLKQLNEALNRDSDNWELRLLRAYLSYSLPEVFFHTTQQAVQDFRYLKNAYEQNNRLYAKELYEQILADWRNASKRLE